MIKADLHVHSNFSDGSSTISELINQAKINGVDVIAITDHDTVSHLPQLPKDENIKIIGGIEISAFDPESGVKAHILGYNIKNIKIVEKLVTPLLEARHASSSQKIQILNKNGFAIDVCKLNKASGKYIYKQHIIEYLVETGQAPEMFGEFYKKIFKNGGICDFDIEYINAFDAIKTIKAAGGQAVLAHPGQQQNFHLIPSLVKCGLNGLELNHPSNSTLDKDVINKHAEQYCLFLTGGSDYHGKYQKVVHPIGEFISDESGVSALCY